MSLWTNDDGEKAVFSLTVFWIQSGIYSYTNVDFTIWKKKSQVSVLWRKVYFLIVAGSLGIIVKKKLDFKHIFRFPLILLDFKSLKQNFELRQKYEDASSRFAFNSVK